MLATTAPPAPRRYAPGYSANTYYNQGYAAPVQGGYYDAPQAYYAPPPPPPAYYEPAPRYHGYGRSYGYGYGYRGGYYPQAYVAPSVGYSFTYVGR